MNNQPFYKKQSFWLNIWVWWGGLGIIQVVLLSGGELLGKVGKITGFLVPFFSSFLYSGEVSMLFTKILDELSPSPERLILGALFSLVGVYTAQWYSKRIVNLVQRVLFNVIMLVIITFTADFMMFAIPV